MKTAFLAIIFLLVLPLSLAAQEGLSVLEIMNDGRPRYEAERLVIVQDPALDTTGKQAYSVQCQKRGCRRMAYTDLPRRTPYCKR